MKLWLLEFEELIRDFHDKNYNYTRHPDKEHDTVLLSNKRRTISKTPFPNTLYNFATNGYPSGIKADYDKIISKQTELNEFINCADKFKTALDTISIKFPVAPTIQLPEIIVSYNFAILKEGEYKLKNYNSENSELSVAKTPTINVVIAKQIDISSKMNAINKTNSIFFANIKMDLYIYFAFCTLYGEVVSEKYKETNELVDKLTIHFIKLTSIVANITVAATKDNMEASGKNPPRILKFISEGVPEYLDISGTIHTINKNYEELMNDFLVKYKGKVVQFVESLKTCKNQVDNIKINVDKMQTDIGGSKNTKGVYSYLIVKGNEQSRKLLWENWNKNGENGYKTACSNLNQLTLTLDADYKTLLDKYDTNSNELPMCRSNLLQTTSMVLSPPGLAKKVAIGAGYIIASPLVAVAAAGFVVVVVLPGAFLAIKCLSNSCGGSKKKTKKNNKKRYNKRRNSTTVNVY